jgi:Flp pilus assembly protein TadG
MLRTSTILRRFGADVQAVSAVEFAVLFPVMLVLLLGSLDIARAVNAKNKASLLSRTISDFVSQSTTITQSELDNIVQAAGAVMYPYASDTSVLSVTVESIREKPSDPGKYIIDWSYKKGAANGVSNTDVNIPADQNPPDASVIRTTIDYTFNLEYASFLVESIDMHSSTFMSPRWGTPITASW